MTSPHRWIAAHAGHSPDAVALIHEGASLTYAGLHEAVQRLAGAMVAAGLRKGDRVAFLGHNHPAQIIQLLACCRLGMIQVPMNWRLAAPELAFMLADSGAKLVMATAEFERAAATLGLPVVAAEAAWPGGLDSAGEPPEWGAPEDIALLVYTSGTTGRPKGALLSQRAIFYNALNAQHLFSLTAADRVLTVLPLFHVGGLNIQTMPALYAGATVMLEPRFEPARFMAACTHFRPTLTLLVPAVMQALLSHPGWAAADLSSLRAAGAGSSDVPPRLIEAFHERGVPIQQIYGATETCPIAIGQTRAEALAAPGSIGRPALHARAKVVGMDGADLPMGETGQIAIAGPGILDGYWNLPEASRDSIRDGWFLTGDVGHVDAAGRWWFTDRVKHVIISGGENIYPAEVERVLATAPGIREGAVTGRADPQWGEVPVAVVVPGEGFSAQAVLAHFQGQLARFKCPRDVVVVEALPRTALGKVASSALRALV
ncbi:AMP-binding protein [Acetobacteraceae bacterium H6797]|nr:AMP-binding protein [Acetobacteraceae bacterium H6797]